MNMPAEHAPQAQSTAIPKRWPVTANLQTRSNQSPPQWGARLVNAYAEFDPEDKAGWVYKRPGMSPTPLMSASGLQPGNGTYCYATAPSVGDAAAIFSVFGTTLYATTINGASTAFQTVVVGTVDGTAPYFFETINSSPQTVVLGNGIAAYVVVPFTNTFTKITDANFPLDFVPGWVYLDGFLYIMDTGGKIWGTAGQNNALVWSGTNVISASSNADSGIGMIKQLTYVIALKQWTAQVFYDAGNATGSPLGVVPDAQLPLGGFSGASIQVIDNTALWLTANQTAQPQVVQMDNLAPRIISTPSVERLLAEAAFSGTNGAFTVGLGISSWILKLAGHRFFGLTLVTLNITLVYDIDQKLWYQWTDVGGNYWPIIGMTYFPQYQLNVPPFTHPYLPGLHLAQHYSNGNLYILDASYVYPTDYGNIVPVDIYTRNIDADTVRRKFFRTLYLVGDKVSGSSVKIRYSDDDYQTWSNFQEVSMNFDKPRIGPLGTFEYRRAIHIRHQKATALRLRDMDMQVDLGTL